MFVVAGQESLAHGVPLCEIICIILVESLTKNHRIDKIVKKTQNVCSFRTRKIWVIEIRTKKESHFGEAKIMRLYV